DLRYGFRMLLKHPGFTAIAVFALALGIGANTSIFSVVNAVLLRPLPFAEPSRLVNLFESYPQRGIEKGSASYPNFIDWKNQSELFEGMASYHQNDFILTGVDEPARLEGAVINADMFSLLGVTPTLGRAFRPEEDKPGDSG